MPAAMLFFMQLFPTDHRANQHFIIPEMADSSLDLSELAKAAKKKLQAVRFMASRDLFKFCSIPVEQPFV
jgi:hypothetical protein